MTFGTFFFSPRQKKVKELLEKTILNFLEIEYRDFKSLLNEVLNKSR